jgi:hypothetical protein
VITMIMVAYLMLVLCDNYDYGGIFDARIV